MIELKLPEDSSPVASNPYPDGPELNKPQLMASVTALQPQSNFMPIAFAFVLGLLVSYVLVREFAHDPINRGPIDEQKQIVDDRTQPTPPKPTPPSPALKDCLLLVVRDAKSTNDSPEYMATLQNDTFWRVTAPSIVKDVEFLEDDDDKGKKLISFAGIPAPIVMLYNVQTKKVVWTIPLPKGSVSEIERKLK